MQFALAVFAGAAVVAASEPWGYGPPPAYNSSSAAEPVPAYSTPAAPEYTHPTEYTTAVLTAYTTYCPEATELTYGASTYTVTEATTLTITDCPCTVTMPVYSSTPVAPGWGSSAPGYGSSAPGYGSSAWAPSSSSAPWYPAANSTAPAYTPPAGTAPGYASSTAPVAPAYTGAADKVSFGVAGLLAAAGLVAAL